MSFLSLVIISLMAVTAYLGLSFSAEGLLRSTNLTYETENAADIEISAAQLLTDGTLEQMRSAEGVTDAEGIISIPSRVSSGEQTENVTLRSVSERISRPHLKDGRLPGAEGECAVEKTLAEKMDYRVGSRVQLANRSERTDMVIKGKSFTVTGIFTTADHLTEMISFEPTILVTRDAFKSGLIPEDRYTCVLVRIEAGNPYRFSKDWKDSADRVAERLETPGSRWRVTALHHTSSYVCTEEDADMLNTMSVTFSMLFVVIAALVIYSTIGRLVEQDSRLVGASKAMGLKNSEVFAKYLIFGVGGTLIGVTAGILTAYFAFERIILYFFGSVFLLGEWAPAFQTVPVIIVAAGAAALSAAAVFLACRRLLKSSAVSLMKGENTAGYGRKKKSSGNGALYLRLILRNIRTDKKRVVVSVVSIAGCCMLLMIGFSLKYAISRVTERQYGEIQRYSMKITLDPTLNATAMDQTRDVLDQEDLSYAVVYSEEIPYQAGDEQGLLRLICPEKGEDLSGYYCLKDPESGKILRIPESGMLVARMFAEQYGLNAGDGFQVLGGEMEMEDTEIAGIYENYIGICSYCSGDYAEKCLKKAVSYNTLLLKNDPRDTDALREKLSGISGFVSLDSAREQEALFNGLSTMLNLIIVLLGFLAVMIACFILLNLVSTYVSQKKNELTIMRINGYTTGETMRYASMECYGITLLGILIGLAAGQAFSSFVIGRIEQISMSYVHDPMWISFAASAAVTAVISGVIHTLAFRQIRGLKLSDMQK